MDISKSLKSEDSGIRLQNRTSGSEALQLKETRYPSAGSFAIPLGNHRRVKLLSRTP